MADKTGDRGNQANHHLNLDVILAEVQSQRRRPQGEAPPSPVRPNPEPAVPPVEPAPADDHDIKIYTPKIGMKTSFTEKEAARMLDRTSDIWVRRAPAQNQDSPPEDTSDQGEQLTFEQLDIDEGLDLSDAPLEPDGEQEDDGEWEVHFRDIRRQKVENFRLLQDVVDRELEADKAADAADQEDKTFEDFTSYEQTDLVRSELQYRRSIGAVVLVVDTILALASVLLVAAGYLPININPTIYMLLHMALLALLMATQYRVLWRGFRSLFRGDQQDGRVSTYTVVALLSLVTLLHTACQLLWAPPGTYIAVFTPAAAIALWFCAIGRQYDIARICQNFRFVSYPGPKYAARQIDNPAICDKFISGRLRQAVLDDPPQFVYYQNADFLSGYLEHAYDEQGSDRAAGWLAGIGLLLSVAATLIGVFGNLNGAEMRDGWKAFSILVAALCLSLPLYGGAGLRRLLLGTAKKSLRAGSMVTGWKAVEQFGRVNGVVVDVEELFPSECIMLHGIKTFYGARIDEVILDAAALSIQAGGPLAHVFRRIIENRTDLLKPVDTLIYEQEMGLSGWVDGRRVLLGNRILLLNHGVDVPSHDYEARYKKDNRHLVYLSVSGELSAMFVVSYLADPGIAHSLKKLQKAGILLMLRCCDQNITADFLNQTFELEEGHVLLLDVSSGKLYEQMTAEHYPARPAILASNGRIEGIATSLSACRRMWGRLRQMWIAQLLIGIGGTALNLYTALHTGYSLSPLLTCGWLLLGGALTWLVTASGKQ